jgi:hypothetical protein
MHDAVCHAAARFRHDASARCFVAHQHSLDVTCRFLRAANTFQLPLFNFYERVSSLQTEADAVTTMMFVAQLLRVSTSHQHLRCSFGGTRDILNSSTSSVTCTFVAATPIVIGTRRADMNGHGTLLRDVGWSQPHM